jgi:hypothetical protein
MQLLEECERGAAELRRVGGKEGGGVSLRLMAVLGENENVQLAGELSRNLKQGRQKIYVEPHGQHKRVQRQLPKLRKIQNRNTCRAWVTELFFHAAGPDKSARISSRLLQHVPARSDFKRLEYGRKLDLSADTQVRMR